MLHYCNMLLHMHHFTLMWPNYINKISTGLRSAQVPQTYVFVQISECSVKFQNLARALGALLRWGIYGGLGSSRDLCPRTYTNACFTLFHIYTGGPHEVPWLKCPVLHRKLIFANTFYLLVGEIHYNVLLEIAWMPTSTNNLILPISTL